MKSLDAKLLKRFVKLAAKRLKGDWVLLGGTVLPLLDRGYRATVDIDFCPVGRSSNEQNLLVMSICEELGLPVETINGAAGYFLHKIGDFNDHLILVEAGQARVFRPDVALYVRLKLGRLSESDLADCIEMLNLEGKTLAPGHRKALLRECSKAETEASAERKSRIKTLLDALS